MMNKVVGLSLIVAMLVFLPACENGGSSFQGLLNAQSFKWTPSTGGNGALSKVAYELESAADKLSAYSIASIDRSTGLRETDMQSCETDNTAVITIYSTNGRAEDDIEVKLNGSHIGELTTYFPNDIPGCKSPSAAGVITRLVSAGEHTLEAGSTNLSWPSYDFSVEKCGCRAIQLP